MMFDENSNTASAAGGLAALPTPTSASLTSATSPSTAGIAQLLNVKDSRWLQVEVCREFQRGQCARSDVECKFAHPPPHVDVQQGRVTACYDSIKGRCTRENPKCKYLHPPQHIKDQLLINGRNNLALKNLLINGQIGAAAAPQVPMNQLAILAQQQAASLPGLGGNLMPTMPYQYYSHLNGLMYQGLMNQTGQTDPYQQNRSSPPYSLLSSSLSLFPLAQVALLQQQQQQTQQQQLLASLLQQQALASAASASVASATSRKRPLEEDPSEAALLALAHASIPCKRPAVDTKSGVTSSVLYGGSSASAASAQAAAAAAAAYPYHLLQAGAAGTGAGAGLAYMPAVSFSGAQLPPRY